MQQPMNERMEKALSRVRDMVDTNTMVGTPIHTPDGITLIPVSRLSFGLASGGGDKDAKESSVWSGIGAAVKVDPLGFVVIREGCVHMLNMTPPAVTPLERLLDTAPELMDKLESYVSKYSQKKKTGVKNTENRAY